VFSTVIFEEYILFGSSLCMWDLTNI